MYHSFRRLGLLVYKAQLALVAIKVMWVHKVYPERLQILVALGLQAQQDLLGKVLQDQRVLQALKALLVLLAQQDLLVWVLLDLKAT
jgi:hypothetical protein